MKTTLFASLAIAFAALSACGNQSAPVSEFPQLIVGTWDCTVRESEDGVIIDVEDRTQFLGNGTYEGAGEIDFRFDNSEAKLRYAADGRWEIEGTSMFEGITDFELAVVEKSGPELEALGEDFLLASLSEGMQEEIDNAIRTESRIEVLNEQRMVSVDVQDGFKIRCERAS